MRRLNTFGDEVFADPKVLKSYFYGITHFVVGGRCQCNGHSNVCIPDSEVSKPINKNQRIMCRIRSCVFLIIVTVALLLFLAPVVSSNSSANLT